MTYTYKRLSAADIPSFEQLLNVFGEAFNDIPTYQNTIPSEAYLRSFLEDEHRIALVALDGETVVGGLVAYVLTKFEQERKEVYIYDLAVAEAHRRRGIATELIRQLKTVAKECGAYVIFVQADKGDTAAIKLYGSLGKPEDVIQFDIKVD